VLGGTGGDLGLCGLLPALDPALLGPDVALAAPGPPLDDAGPGSRPAVGSESIRMGPGWLLSTFREPEPEWPLIMPWEARNVLIFSRSSGTELFSLIQSGRLVPNPRHSRRSREHV